MPGRVREFNAIQAAGIAAALGMSVPPGWVWPVNVNVTVPAAAAPPAPAVMMPLAGPQIICARCQRTNVAGARFCSGCGNAL